MTYYGTRLVKEFQVIIGFLLVLGLKLWVFAVETALNERNRGLQIPFGCVPCMQGQEMLSTKSLRSSSQI